MGTRPGAVQVPASPSQLGAQHTGGEDEGAGRVLCRADVGAAGLCKEGVRVVWSPRQRGAPRQPQHQAPAPSPTLVQDAQQSTTVHLLASLCPEASDLAVDTFHVLANVCRAAPGGAESAIKCVLPNPKSLPAAAFSRLHQFSIYESMDQYLTVLRLLVTRFGGGRHQWCHHGANRKNSVTKCVAGAFTQSTRGTWRGKWGVGWGQRGAGKGGVWGGSAERHEA